MPGVACAALITLVPAFDEAWIEPFLKTRLEFLVKLRIDVFADDRDVRDSDIHWPDCLVGFRHVWEKGVVREAPRVALDGDVTEAR